MTLLIAFILMDHIGGFSSMAYVCASLLWALHVLFHAAECKVGKG